MQVFVTGFEPFGRFKTNPSQQAVKLLPRTVKIDEGAITLNRLILPTCCTGAWAKLSKEIDARVSGDTPFAVILSGLAGNRENIHFERFALNVRHYGIPDNANHSWDDDYINPEQPDALRTRVKLRELVTRLTCKGVSCGISNHAGSYVCNETYFRAMSALHERKNCRGVLFVHVPPFKSYTPHMKALRPGRRKAAGPEDYASALLEIAKFMGED